MVPNPTSISMQDTRISKDKEKTIIDLNNNNPYEINSNVTEFPYTFTETDYDLITNNEIENKINSKITIEKEKNNNKLEIKTNKLNEQVEFKNNRNEQSNKIIVDLKNNINKLKTTKKLINNNKTILPLPKSVLHNENNVPIFSKNNNIRHDNNNENKENVENLEEVNEDNDFYSDDSEVDDINLEGLDNDDDNLIESAELIESVDNQRNIIKEDNKDDDFSNYNNYSPREILKKTSLPINSILKNSERLKSKSAITVLERTSNNLSNILQTSPSKIIDTPRKKKYKQIESALIPQSPRTLVSLLSSPRTVNAVIPYINPLTSLNRSNSENCLYSKNKNKLSAKDILFNKKLKYLKTLVETAVKSRRTYTVLGHFPNIREAFRSRGWLEKYHDFREEYPRPSNNNKEEHMVSRLLRDTQVNFLWTMRGDTLDWKRISKNTIVSRFPRAYFTTKVGLCSSIQQIHWFSEIVNFPRCHNISSSEDLSELCHDFRLTACLSLLRFVVYSIDSSKLNFFHEDGKVPLCAVEFASRRCAEYLSCQMHEDIDLPQQLKIWDHQWDQFLTWYYQIVHQSQSFVAATKGQIHTIYQCSKHTVENTKKFWPQMHLDGFRNLWIVKPGAKSRGRGIQVMYKLEDIVQRITATNTNDPRFVVQKYIERPLLIYNTKFDIRQWFLVTSAYPLTVWMYKESYLRFCSQNYSLVNMHESVHLSNNAIQCKYQNGTRDKNLPDENMWDCYSFQAYLRSMGVADVWHKIIYPGMVDGIVGSLLASQDSFDHRKNCFELYGADFMLAQNFVPWLIEINSGPCMAASTSVTARLCAQVLEDVIKVVVDRREDRMADTGMFELIYKQTITPNQPYMGQNLTVRGFKMLPELSPKLLRKSKFWTKNNKKPIIKCNNKNKEVCISFNDCTSEVYEWLSKLQVQLMHQRNNDTETVTTEDKGKEIPDIGEHHIHIDEIQSQEQYIESVKSDSKVTEKENLYRTSLDKVINTINDNYRVSFNENKENQCVNIKINEDKKNQKIETKNNKIKNTKDKNVLINKKQDQHDKNIIQTNLDKCDAENMDTKDNLKKNNDDLDIENKNNENNLKAMETMEEDEIYQIELDENLNVYEDYPENNNEVLEKGFEYFYRENNNNKTMNKKYSKEKLKKYKKRKKTDENLELLNEWKLKVSETRKHCKDIVNNLKLKTNLMKTKTNKFDNDKVDWNNNVTNKTKKLSLPETKKELLNTLPIVKDTIIQKNKITTVKSAISLSSNSPTLINSPNQSSKSPTFLSKSATSYAKSPSPNLVSPCRSPFGSKSSLSSPHLSPRSSNALFPCIKQTKSPETLYAVGMSLKCFTNNKDQMIAA